jgi:tetrahydromethanopterin S-methyltransferase subunit B
LVIWLTGFCLSFATSGDNPLILNKCETYGEEGFTLTNKEKNLKVTTTIPSALTAPFIEDIGNFTVTYTVYEGRERLGSVERLVVVNPINPCELPPGHRCGHKCHPYAKCVFLGGADYDCECREGFDQVTDPVTGETYCRDNQPPVIYLQGQNPTILRACRVCKWYDPGESYSEEKHGGFYAYDSLPDGRQVDLTSRVVVTNETRGTDEWVLYYNVEDAAGNKAETKTRVVRKEVEDVFEKIARMEQFLEERFEDFQPAFTTYNAIYYYGRWLAQALFFLAGFLVLWVVLPRFLGLIKVLFLNPNPTFPEFQYAYDSYYTLTRPWWNQQEREKQTMVMVRSSSSKSFTDPRVSSLAYMIAHAYATQPTVAEEEVRQAPVDDKTREPRVRVCPGGGEKPTRDRGSGERGELFKRPATSPTTTYIYTTNPTTMMMVCR